MLDQATLRKHLYYDAVGGNFYWRNPPAYSGFLPWSKAGSVNCDGHIKIQLHKKCYLAHRLAWLYVHGQMPRDCIDHKNECKTDNRIENLRQATKGQNNFNTGLRSTNKSGVKGVRWRAESKKWVACFKANYVSINVGSFDTLEEAAKAIHVARIKHHGEFANTGIRSERAAAQKEST